MRARVKYVIAVSFLTVELTSDSASTINFFIEHGRTDHYDSLSADLSEPLKIFSATFGIIDSRRAQERVPVISAKLLEVSRDISTEGRGRFDPCTRRGLMHASFI